MKPVILFESYPDFNGNSLEIYNELIRRGYDKKYDLVWAVYDDFNIPTDKKIVKLFSKNSFCNLNPSNKPILDRTKLIIDSNRYIYKYGKAFRFHVRHGCCLKNSQGYNRGLGNVDGILTTSEQMLKLDQQIFAPDIANKFVITGMPVTDKLFSPKNLYSCGFMKELTGSTNKYSKIIGWLPTYRDHRHHACGKNRFPFGLPGIHNLAEFTKLNDILKSKNMLLVVQQHHAQAKNYDAPPKCSNIVFVNEVLKNKYNVSTSDLLGNFDALLTDYSSAYHEYIILNRPIGLVVEDLIEYAKKNGFFCNYLEWIKGDYIKDNNGLCNWLIDISNNIDRSKKLREDSLHKIHKYIDNKSTQRVVDYLVNKFGL